MRIMCNGRNGGIICLFHPSLPPFPLLSLSSLSLLSQHEFVHRDLSGLLMVPLIRVLEAPPPKLKMSVSDPDEDEDTGARKVCITYTLLFLLHFIFSSCAFFLFYLNITTLFPLSCHRRVK